MSTFHPRSRCDAIAVAAITVVLAGCVAPAPAPAPKAWRVAPNYRIANAGPGADHGYMALARQYEGERRWREARDAWRKAARAAPEDVEILNALGMAEAGQGRYADAVAALRRAVALAPDRVPLLNNLGYALLLAGHGEEARSVLRGALARAPDHRLARANLDRVDAVAVATPSLATARGDAAANPAATASTSVSSRRIAESPPLPPGDVSAHAARVQTTPNLEPLRLSQAGAAAEPPRPAAPVLPVAVRAREAAGARVEIANGNGVAGMAAWLDGWLRARGLASHTVLSNVRPFNTAITVVHYRAGFAADAQGLADRLPQRVAIAAEPGGAFNADVRVVLGRDMAHAARSVIASR